MPTIPTPDTWLLPTQQRTFPARDHLAPEVLHRRRELTFLVLAGTFSIATAAMLILVTRVVDLSALITAWTGTSVGTSLLLPIGVVAFPVSLVTVALIVELYGARRARAVVVFGVLAAACLVGLSRLGELAGDGAIGPALAMTACYVVAHFVNVMTLDLTRRKLGDRHLWLRMNLATLLAQIVGWVAFGAVTYAFASQPDVAAAQIRAIALGSSVYTVAIVLVATLPVVLVARGFRVVLRVGGRVENHEDEDEDADVSQPVLLVPRVATRQPAVRAEGSNAGRPPAMIVDGDPPPFTPLPKRRQPKPSIPPYSSAEMRFFAEGETLEH